MSGLETNLDEFVTLEEFSRLLKVSPKTLRNKRSSDPDYFPPALQIAGFRQILWRRSDIESWLSSKIQGRRG